MKSLQEYIRESLIKEANDESLSFNFAGLKKTKETIEELQKLCDNNKIHCNVDGEKVHITVNPDAKEKTASILELLKKYSKEMRSDTENASHESFAQLTKSFENSVKKLEEFFNSDNSEDKDKEEDKDTKDEKDKNDEE